MTNRNPLAPPTGPFTASVDTQTGLPDGSAGIEATAEDWQRFGKLLNDGSDLPLVRRFLADFDISLRLAPVLAMIRPEYQCLAKTVSAGNGAEKKAEQLREEVRVLATCHPGSVEDARAIGQRLPEARAELSKAERQLGEAREAFNGVCALRSTFPEIVQDQADVKLDALPVPGGGLPATISNALIVAGFNPRNLYQLHWRKAFKRAPEPKKRRRLVTRK